MVKATELRINNIVETPYGTSIIYGISNDCVQITLSNNESVFDFDIEDIEPIPLTEELLLKCGFEYFQIDRYKFLKYKSDNLDFLFKDGKVKIRIQGVANIEWFMELEYLHKLQNFFALTNQELKCSI